MNKNEVITAIEAIVTEANSHNNGFHYEMTTNDWANYGKDRTYFAIVETRENSKHYVKKDYGYYDNIADKYVEGKARIGFTFSGVKM